MKKIIYLLIFIFTIVLFTVACGKTQEKIIQTRSKETRQSRSSGRNSTVDSTIESESAPTELTSVLCESQVKASEESIENSASSGNIGDYREPAMTLDARIALFTFNGIPETERDAQYATEPLFFIIVLEDGTPCLYDEHPRLLNDLADQIEIVDVNWSEK